MVSFDGKAEKQRVQTHATQHNIFTATVSHLRSCTTGHDRFTSKWRLTCAPPLADFTVAEHNEKRQREGNNLPGRSCLSKADRGSSHDDVQDPHLDGKAENCKANLPTTLVPMRQSGRSILEGGDSA